MRTWRKEMRADREATEAYPERMEANAKKIKSVALHEEVPKEEATVRIFGAQKKRYGDRHLAVRRRRQLKKRTQSDGGSLKK
jgi:hypothetical protein